MDDHSSILFLAAQQALRFNMDYTGILHDRVAKSNNSLVISEEREWTLNERCSCFAGNVIHLLSLFYYCYYTVILAS